MLYPISLKETFSFKPEDRIEKANLGSLKIVAVAVDRTVSNKIHAGTAIVVYSDHEKTALLACEHVVVHPDTLFGFYRDSPGERTSFLEKLIIKRRDENIVADLPGQFEILAIC